MAAENPQTGQTEPYYLLVTAKNVQAICEALGKTPDPVPPTELEPVLKENIARNLYIALN